VAEHVTAPKRATRKWTDYLTRKRVIGGIIAIVALLFIFQNTGTGEFHFLTFDVKAPRWLWILGVFLAGYATCWLWTRHRAASSSKERG
jgi:uncharacterized integral membrane protein